MNTNRKFSLMQPEGAMNEYRTLPEYVMHDLGLDAFCKEISSDASERRMITNVLSKITDDPAVAVYRQQIFKDIYNLPELRKTMMEPFDKIQFMHDFSGMHKTSDEELGLWHLFNRLEDLDSYIRIVEAMRDCLADERIQSDGLIALRKYISDLYEDACFADMKKDIAKLRMKASDVKSVTIGVNVNERFEAVSVGLVSVNKKSFKKSGIVSNFADAIASKVGVDRAEAELLPEDKVTATEKILAESEGKGAVAFIGDGVNDAPVLMRCDVGIAMGSMGSDAAIEAADVVLMDDDPLKIARAIAISRRCMRIVYENIYFAIGIKIICLILGTVGITNMWLAVFADVGVMVLAVLNALRALRLPKV